eukprot:1355454-Pyramimonas_sp.AAC.1
MPNWGTWLAGAYMGVSDTMALNTPSKVPDLPILEKCGKELAPRHPRQCKAMASRKHFDLGFR